MTDGPSILLIDSNASDRTLSMLLLRRGLPEAVITPAPDALAFSDALVAGPPDVAIVAADLAWANVNELIATIKRRRPATAVILFGHESDLTARALGPALAFDGLVRKSSAGFLGLAPIITEVLARTGHPVHAAAEAPAAAPAPAAVNRPPEEMREIALVFSHDLREPVQQIVRLARRAQAAAGPQNSAHALQHVLECAERVGGMLDGMIEYLTVTERDAAPAPVDLNACLNQALDNLRTVLDESRAEIRTTPLPASVGDEHQIVHLFQNLVSNAIKFRNREPPVVTISVEPRGDQWLLAFRDNGIGIPQAFTERIFEFGKRLHTREEYPGRGIGLALCRRIVERHGGRIWGESGEGKGSTFYVLLPRAPAEAASPGEPTLRRAL